MKRYFAAYERELNAPQSLEGETLSFRQLFRRQAERLQHVFIDNQQYEPFRLPC
jgi:hypothetical protein